MRLTTLLITLTLFSACREKQSRNLQLQEQTVTGDRVEVIYFHGKQRCMTYRGTDKRIADRKSRRSSENRTDRIPDSRYFG